uniref:T3.5 protein n=1 Tax=Malus x robusta TaxID=1184610 RepID=I7KCW8_9ROSA|nr:T3.5 [Malus x robusta]
MNKPISPSPLSTRMKVCLQQVNKIFTSALDNDLETTAPAEPPPAAAAASSRPPRKHNFDWATIILAYCLSTAIAMALIPIQVHSKQLPLTFCFLGLVITLSFSSILVTKCIQNSKCPRIIVHLFHYFGVFFGVTAFFVSITIPFPLWFKCTASVIYAASGLGPQTHVNTNKWQHHYTISGRELYVSSKIHGSTAKDKYPCFADTLCSSGIKAGPSLFTCFLVKSCKSLWELEWGLCRLTSHRYLWIGDEDPDTVSFPPDMVLMETLLLKSLTELSIGGFPNLKKPSSKGFQFLSSLESLELWDCPKLASIPAEGLPLSLTELCFYECPVLKERWFWREKDWAAMTACLGNCLEGWILWSVRLKVKSQWLGAVITGGFRGVKFGTLPEMLLAEMMIEMLKQSRLRPCNRSKTWWCNRMVYRMLPYPPLIYLKVVATGMDALTGCGAGRPLEHLVELPTGSDPGELLDLQKCVSLFRIFSGIKQKSKLKDITKVWRQKLCCEMEITKFMDRKITSEAIQGEDLKLFETNFKGGSRAVEIERVAFLLLSRAWGTGRMRVNPSFFSVCFHFG